MPGIQVPFIFLSIAAIIIAAFVTGKRIYDQISQLSYHNKLLIALRNLDKVALSTTEVDSICQEIVDVIHDELGYFFGAIALKDDLNGGLRRIAISDYAELSDVVKKLPIEYKKQVVPFSQADNLLVKAALEKKDFYTPYLRDVQSGIFPAEFSDKLQQALFIKGLFVYPLITQNGVIGVIYYCTLIERQKFSRFEFAVMEEFTREVSRVLNSVFLYQNVRKASTELLNANKKLRELDQLKDDFVSLTSHELRTPMAAIRSYAWMALNRSDAPLSENVERYLARILISTERLINLVNDMLNISRIESGKIEIKPEVVDLISLCKDIIDEVYFSKATDKNIHFSLLEEPIPKVFADPEKLRQVVLNVVGNALKFSPRGGKITIGFFSDGKLIETYIKDEGPGISREDLSKLFQKFGRLDSSYTAAATSGGTGLGLYISKSLIELMKGRIWATSEGLGKGATFALALPVATKEVLSNAGKYAVKPHGEVKGLEPMVTM